MTDHDRSIDRLTASLQIDLTDLSAALVTQPVNYLEARNLVVQFTAARDRTKRELEEARSTGYISVRTEMTAAGEKVTEAQVNARVETLPEIVAKCGILSTIQETLGKAQALADAYAQRGYMLRELVVLHADQYRASVAGEPIYDVLRQKHADARQPAQA